MDTRTKILPWNEGQRYLQTAAAVLVVTGHFDPLLAAHAARLRESAIPGRPLAVVITEPPDPLLPAAARAELVAGLAVVDRVILGPPEGPLRFPEAVPESSISRAEDWDRGQTRDLVRHVHRRQRAQAAIDG